MSLSCEWVDSSTVPSTDQGLRLRILARETGDGAAAPGVLAGSYDEVAERLSEYADLGIDHFLLVAEDPDAERAHFDRGVVPALERRGLVTRTTPAGAGRRGSVA